MMEGKKSGKVKKTRARKKPYYIPITIVDDVTETVHIENSMLKFVAYEILRDIGFTEKTINHILYQYLRSYYPLEYSVKYYIESYFEGIPLE